MVSFFGCFELAAEQLTVALDGLDERLLDELRRDSRQSFRTLAEKLRVSPATVIARLRRLEREGVVLGYTADLDYARLGYEFCAVIEVTITKGALLEVQKKIAQMPGIVSVYDVTGERDSMVLARVKSRREFSRLVKKILAIDKVQASNTHVVLNTVKEDGRMMTDVITAESK